MSAGQTKEPFKAEELLAYAVLVFLVLVVLAIVLHDPVVRAIVIANYHLLTWIDVLVDDRVVTESIKALKTVKSVDELTWGDAFALTALTGEYLRWVIVPPLVLLGIMFILGDPIAKYRTIKGFQELVEDKAKAFPTIRPVVGLNLLDKKHYKDNWRPQENPFEFSIRHKLLKRRDGEEEITLSIRELRKLDATQFSNKHFFLDEEAARLVFEGQLGELINPNDEPPETPQEALKMVMKLPAHYRALIAVMLGRYVGGRQWRDRTYDLIEQFANSFYVPTSKNRETRTQRLTKKLKDWGLEFLAPALSAAMFWLKTRPDFKVENLNIQGVDEAIKELMLDEKNRLRIMQVFRKRAWAHTFMIDLLERAREYGGILITADFIWLKPMDRQLFYVLNSVGRKTPQVEAAGAFAHYYAEDVLGRPLPVPEVSMAVAALKKFLIKEGWLPEEETTSRTSRLEN